MCGREARSVRRRCMTYSSSSEGNDPYENEVLLDEHFRDLARFARLYLESRGGDCSIQYRSISKSGRQPPL